MGTQKTEPTQELVTVEEHRKLKKSVGAIHSSGNLTLVQRKLANVLLYSAYDSLLSKRTHTIPLSIMCNMLGWDESNKLEHLKEALQKLAETSIQFNLKEDGKDVWRVMSMISFGEIKDGFCTYRYDEYLAERLFDPVMYAVINLSVQKKFDSGHALNLYENCLRFKDTQSGSTGWWTLEFLRDVMGATGPHYDEFFRLNSKAIKPAVEQINRESDILLTPEFKKTGRSVSEIRFLVVEKTKEQKNTNHQASLPGLSFNESIDAYQEIRKTKAFQELKKHGISDRLSMAWIRDEGEERIIDIVAYTEEKDQAQQLKKPSAYIRTLIEQKAEIGSSTYEAKKVQDREKQQTALHINEQQSHLDDLKNTYRNITTTARINALSIDAQRTYAEAYIREVGSEKATTFNPTTVTFKDVVEKAKFRDWIRKAMAPEFDLEAFKVWVVADGKISLKDLGL